MMLFSPNIVVVDDNKTELESITNAFIDSGIQCFPIKYFNDDPASDARLAQAGVFTWRTAIVGEQAGGSPNYAAVVASGANAVSGWCESCYAGDPGRTRTCDLLIRNSLVAPYIARVYDDELSIESMESMEVRKCVSTA